MNVWNHSIANWFTWTFSFRVFVPLALVSQNWVHNFQRLSVAHFTVYPSSLLRWWPLNAVGKARLRMLCCLCVCVFVCMLNDFYPCLVFVLVSRCADRIARRLCAFFERKQTGVCEAFVGLPATCRENCGDFTKNPAKPATKGNINYLWMFSDNGTQATEPLTTFTGAEKHFKYHRNTNTHPTSHDNERDAATPTSC